MSLNKIWVLESPDGKRYVGSSPAGALLTYTRAERDPVEFMKKIDDAIDQQKMIDDRRDLAVAMEVASQQYRKAGLLGESKLKQIIAKIPIEEWVEEHIKERP